MTRVTRSMWIALCDLWHQACPLFHFARKLRARASGSAAAVADSRARNT